MSLLYIISYAPTYPIFPSMYAFSISQFSVTNDAMSGGLFLHEIKLQIIYHTIPQLLDHEHISSM